MGVHLSHVIVGVTHALAESDLRKVDPASWKVLSYQDNNTLGGVPQFSFTLPGRAALLQDGRRVPWRSLLSAGDLVQSAGWLWTGEREAKPVTMMDGVIKRVSGSENRGVGSYEYTTTVQCAGYQDVMMRDAVAWWMHYGTVEGWAHARGTLLPDDLSGQVDKMMANYLNKVVFHTGSWRRGQQTLGNRVGYHLRSLKPNAGIQTNLAVAEGTHWSIMGSLLDAPLHELYTVVKPADFTPQGGFAHKPDAPKDKAIVGQIAADGGRTYVMLRPAPYPYGSKGGKVHLDEWKALKLWDFTGETYEPMGERGHDTSDDGVRNFVMVYPAFQGLDESMAFTHGIAVENRDSISRYGYSPLKTRTMLVIDKGAKQDFIELAHSLTWRLAVQQNLNDTAMQGSVVAYLNPYVQPGERARVRDPEGDQSADGVYEAHITSVSRSWTPEQGGSMNVSIERMRPLSWYTTKPEHFAAGLRSVKAQAESTAPTAKPD